jgi:hypothetical protein
MIIVHGSGLFIDIHLRVCTLLLPVSATAQLLGCLFFASLLLLLLRHHRSAVLISRCCIDINVHSMLRRSIATNRNSYMCNNSATIGGSGSSKSIVAIILLTITTLLHLRSATAICNPGEGWNQYPPTYSSVQCPIGTIIIAIQAQANGYNNLGYFGNPSSFNMTCSDGSTIQIGNTGNMLITIRLFIS